MTAPSRSQIESRLDNALRVALRSETRPQAALYFCRILRDAAFNYVGWLDSKPSLGLSWLSNNHEQFHELVPNATSFFRSLLDEERCACHIVHDKYLLGLISPHSQERFILDVNERYPTGSSMWIYSVREAGWTDESLASLLLSAMRTTAGRPDAAGSRTILEAFLRTGLSSEKKDWVWDIFDSAQFYEAIRICAASNGGMIFSYAEQLLPRIAKRLTPQQYEEILGLTSEFASEPRFMSVANLAMFPAEVQLRAVACSMDLSPDVVVHVATLPGGREAIIAYLQRARQTYQAWAEKYQRSQPSTVLHGLEALLELLSIGPLRNIENVPIELPVL